jgi:GntR family transcriptional repressor for pyruvate dehydrogenase complex
MYAAVSSALFRPVPKVAAMPQKVVAQMRDLLAQGQLRAGDRLPGERELAESFAVGRTTIREALRIMESLGFVTVRSGYGTYLTDPEAAGRAPGADLLKRSSNRLDLFEVRALMEPRLAALAARRATPDHLTSMRDALDAQQTAVRRGDSGTQEDAAFHLLIAESAGNPTLTGLARELSQVLGDTRRPSLQLDGRPARSLGEHRGILAAIARRNPGLAARRMADHISGLEETLFAAGPASGDAGPRPT